MLVGQGGIIGPVCGIIGPPTEPKIGLIGPPEPKTLRAEQVQRPGYHLPSWTTFLLAWAWKSHPWVRFFSGQVGISCPWGLPLFRPGKITFLAEIHSLYQSDEPPHIPMGHMVLGPWYR